MRYTPRRSRVGGIAALLALVVSVPAAQAQTPVINSVSGATTQGSLLTISGANLNAETMQNWDSWFSRNPTAWSFEGASPLADGFQPGGNTTGVYDSKVRLLGNQSIRFHSAITNPNCIQGIGQNYNYLMLDDSASNTDYWVRVYVRWNRLTNWPSNYMKMLYALNEAYYFQPAGASAPGTNPSWFDAAHSGSSHLVAAPSGPIQNNRWYAIELHWSTSPRLYEAWIDGVRVHSGTPAKVGTNSGLRLLLLGIINACGTTSWDVDHWMDGLAVAHQRIHPATLVEVGDGPNYSTAKKNVQPLEQIADDQVVFKLDTNGLGAGPYYVWVTNNRQQVSSAYFLTGGQVSGPTAPANPRIVSSAN